MSIEKNSHKKNSSLSGVELIKSKLQTLPLKPGVYRMLDKNGDALYIGKAKFLRNRVASYTRLGMLPERLIMMINQTHNMEFVITKTEAEALLLEANLIKRLKPKYNILMQDDKSYPYILIREDHAAPALQKHRGKQKIKGSYFGPFASAHAVNNMVDSLQKMFLLRTCSDSVYKNRSRPCLLYQIKRCSAPCTNEISIENYKQDVATAKNFLKGNTVEVRQELNRLMQDASKKMDYETAARYRDRLYAIDQNLNQQASALPPDIEADVFALHHSNKKAVIQVFFFRLGMNWGNSPLRLKIDEYSNTSNILLNAITQFYDDKPIPKHILTSHELDKKTLSILTSALEAKKQAKVYIENPKRGQKFEAVQFALKNAQETMLRQMAEEDNKKRQLAELQKLFNIPHEIKRVEVYDNSHHSGKEALGAMIVVGENGFLKREYRKYNFKEGGGEKGDDYAMMHEMFKRRFTRIREYLDKSSDENAKSASNNDSEDNSLQDNENEQSTDYTIDYNTPKIPDLIIVDGGRGQLNIVDKLLHEFGLSDKIHLISIAKGDDRHAGRELIYQPNKPEFRLNPRDERLFILQRFRDEAHNYAIGSHRKKKSKEFEKSMLDEIEGIGKSRKQILLNVYGTAKAVSQAPLKELEQIPGISKKIAHKIFNYFHD